MEKEEEVKKTLDNLLKNAKTSEDFIDVKFLIDDYLEQGYHIKSYIFKYNLIYQKFLDKE